MKISAQARMSVYPRSSAPSPAGEAGLWPEEGGGWDGRPGHQIRRLGLLHPARGRRALAHIPVCRRQVCSHGWRPEEGEDEHIM